VKKSTITAEQRIWSIIDLIRQRSGMTDSDVASVVGVTDRTVRSDRMNPAKIPLERLIAYLSIGVPKNQIASSVEALVLSAYNRQKE
jgi:hypothetical protein